MGRRGEEMARIAPGRVAVLRVPCTVFGALLVAALAATDGVRWSVELCGCVPSAGVL